MKCLARHTCLSHLLLISRAASISSGGYRNRGYVYEGKEEGEDRRMRGREREVRDAPVSYDFRLAPAIAVAVRLYECMHEIRTLCFMH